MSVPGLNLIDFTYFRHWHCSIFNIHLTVGGYLSSKFARTLTGSQWHHKHSSNNSHTYTEFIRASCIDKRLFSASGSRQIRATEHWTLSCVVWAFSLFLPVTQALTLIFSASQSFRLFLSDGLHVSLSCSRNNKHGAKVNAGGFCWLRWEQQTKRWRHYSQAVWEKGTTRKETLHRRLKADRDALGQAQVCSRERENEQEGVKFSNIRYLTDKCVFDY